MTLRQAEVVFRGTTYVVSEIDGKTMKAVRKMLADSPHDIPVFVVATCTRSPRLSIADADALPYAAVKLISDKSFEMTNEQENEPPVLLNDVAAKDEAPPKG